MKNTSSILTEKVVNSAINSLRKKKRIELLSFAAIAKELDVGIDELSSFYTPLKTYFLKLRRKTGNRSIGIGINKLRKPKLLETI